MPIDSTPLKMLVDRWKLPAASITRLYNLNDLYHTEEQRRVALALVRTLAADLQHALEEGRQNARLAEVRARCTADLTEE